MSRNELSGIMQPIGKYGLPTVLLVWLIWSVVIPMKDGHLKFLDRTAQTIEQVAETGRDQTVILREIGASQTEIVRTQQLLLQKSGDRWTATDDKNWVDDFSRRNPELDVPKAEASIKDE